MPGSEGTYVCPVDGRKYDYRLGFVKDDGIIVPGHSIEQQIPDWMGNKY